ncbi:MAG: polyprenyl synthetase family protein [Lentisphaerae bacterium]|nr:polyprenyl synthetase family protein [Lentisphaerota bacterium]
MENDSQDDEMEAVKALMRALITESSVAPLIGELSPLLGVGKMLRGRLVLAVGNASGVAETDRITCAAVIELSHLATLLHDDVLDNGALRRGNPAFWVAKGASAAILMGDYLLCRALKMMTNFGDNRLTGTLVDMLQMVCDAELEQEMLLCDEDDWEQCLSVARRKTGSLFAFAATACAGANVALAPILFVSGFDLGTAYQLADDLLDARGDADSSDKTLGQDARREKLTAATFGDDAAVDPIAKIEELLKRAEARLADWPLVQEAWSCYTATYFKPVVSLFTAVGA